MPTSMIAAISSHVPTGRRINRRDGLIWLPRSRSLLLSLTLALALRRLTALSVLARRGRYRHLLAVPQAVSAISNHTLARGQPGQHLRLLAICRTQDRKSTRLNSS